MLLVIAYSTEARQTLRNICRAHEDGVVHRAGQTALLEPTEFCAFQALRLREKHGEAVQVEQTAPFNEFERVRPAVRDAARAYESRDTAATPYERFAAGTTHPEPGTMKQTEL